MIMLATTSLDRRVKKGLLEKRYSREESRAIYERDLAIEAQRKRGMRVASLAMMFVFLLIGGLSLVSVFKGERSLELALALLLMTAPLLVLALVFVYYSQSGLYKWQLHQAMSRHYADVIKECQERRETAVWTSGEN